MEKADRNLFIIAGLGLGIWALLKCIKNPSSCLSFSNGWNFNQNEGTETEVNKWLVKVKEKNGKSITGNIPVDSSASIPKKIYKIGNRLKSEIESCIWLQSGVTIPKGTDFGKIIDIKIDFVKNKLFYKFKGPVMNSVDFWIGWDCIQPESDEIIIL